MFCRFFNDLILCPWRCIQLSAFIGITFYPYFYFAKDHFHENGLRAYPSAKNPAERDGEQDNTNQKDKRSQHEQENVLRPENLPEQHKLSVDHIQHQQRLPADPHERPGKEKYQVSIAQVTAP